MIICLWAIFFSSPAIRSRSLLHSHFIGPLIGAIQRPLHILYDAACMTWRFYCPFRLFLFIRIFSLRRFVPLSGLAPCYGHIDCHTSQHTPIENSLRWKAHKMIFRWQKWVYIRCGKSIDIIILIIIIMNRRVEEREYDNEQTTFSIGKPFHSIAYQLSGICKSFS